MNSGTMILARLRPEYAPVGQPPEVHAYLAHAAMWVSPCGDRLAPDEAEIVEPFTGNPCPMCLMFATLGSDTPPVARPGLEAASPMSPEFPMASAPERTIEMPGGMLLYAPSWRENVVHYADPAAPTREYGQHGTVVAGLCGEIGWGPHERPRGGWPMCAECMEIASRENL